jgi:hypothetical protein
VTALDLAEAYVAEQRRKAAGDTFKYANLVILKCSAGRSAEGEEMAEPHGDWVPLLPSAVPQWLQDPEIIGRMVGGEIVGFRGGAQDVNDPMGEPAAWYRAERLPMNDLAPRVERKQLRAPHAPKIIEAAEILSVDESKPDGVKPA